MARAHRRGGRRAGRLETGERVARGAPPPAAGAPRRAALGPRPGDPDRSSRAPPGRGGAGAPQRRASGASSKAGRTKSFAPAARGPAPAVRASAGSTKGGAALGGPIPGRPGAPDSAGGSAGATFPPGVPIVESSGLSTVEARCRGARGFWHRGAGPYGPRLVRRPGTTAAAQAPAERVAATVETTGRRNRACEPSRCRGARRRGGLPHVPRRLPRTRP